MAAKSAAKNRVPVAGRRVVRRPTWKRRVKIFAALAFVVGGVSFGAGALYFISQLRWADDQLNSSLRDKLNFAHGSETVILARDGRTILYASSDETRDPIEHYDDIPLNVIHATLAAEDKRFFTHTGVDYYALLRSTVADVRERKTAQGGSTITMQLVKRLYTSSEKSFTRKVRDVALAIELEKRLSKPEILQDYLNQVYYGQGAYGIKAASEVYFNKPDLNKLTIGEAALLARLVRRPSDENPFKNRDKAISNRNDVLGVERDEGWIAPEEYEKAVNENLHLRGKNFGSGEHKYIAPYFVGYVLDLLKTEMPDVDFRSGGYTIYTTLDPDMEKVAERQVRETVYRHRGERVTTGAFLLMSADGEILAMVGGVGDYNKHQYNAVVQGRRQPGSSFKPIVYSAALVTGAISPGDYISSGPFVFTDPYTGKVWAPHNDNGFGGPVSIRTAIASSINTAAVRVCQKVGPETVVSIAHSTFGYTSPLKPVLSLALGSEAVSPMEQAQAYSIFQSHGDRATPFGLTKIVGPDDTVVKQYGPDIHKNMLDPDIAAQMDTYLRAVVTSGTAMRALAIRNARGKTGTTQDFRDAWFCGYTNNLIGIGWIANEKHDPNHNPPYYYDPMAHVFGGHATTEMWVGIMRSAESKYGDGQPPPEAPPASGDDETDIQVTRHSRRYRNDSQADNPDTTTDAPQSDQGNQDNPDTSDGDTGKDNPTTPQTPDVPPTPTPTPPPTPTTPPSDPSQPLQNHEASFRANRSRNRHATEMVSVEICADTGLRATSYCPETITKTFVKGSEPTRYCTKHHP